MNNKKIDMKTAIVTGASKGIGKFIALKLATLNYALVVVGRDETSLKKLKEEIEKKRHSLFAFGY